MKRFWKIFSAALVVVGLADACSQIKDNLDDCPQELVFKFYRKTGCDCFADDTGLEVDILGGAPGVHTARYAGEGRDFNANMDKLLEEIARVETPNSTRKARFRTCVTLILDGKTHFFDGVMEGSIARSKAGKGGFGYDPVFMPDGCGGLTAAELSEEEKNAISHRGKALRAMAAFLKD